MFLLQDEDEDWSRWRDVVFRAKGVMRPSNLVIKPPPPQNRRKRGGKADTVSTPSVVEPLPQQELTAAADESESQPGADIATLAPSAAQTLNPEDPSPQQISLEEAIEKVSLAPATGIKTTSGSEQIYCPECYLPLHPDPKPEKLYIFLHALKYTISLGEFSTEMPNWAAEGWEWDQS
jgi:tRNA pseudouridine synthase 9